MDDTFVTQKEENKQNFLEHINSVDPVINFTVEDTRQDGAIPFLDTLVNLRLTIHCLLQCIGSQPTQISICCGTATITCQPSIVLLIPSPTGSEQYAVSQSFSTKKWTTSGRHLVTASMLDGPWTRWKEK